MITGPALFHSGLEYDQNIFPAPFLFSVSFFYQLSGEGEEVGWPAAGFPRQHTALWRDCSPYAASQSEHVLEFAGVVPETDPPLFGTEQRRQSKAWSKPHCREKDGVSHHQGRRPGARVQQGRPGTTRGGAEAGKNVLLSRTRRPCYKCWVQVFIGRGEIERLTRYVADQNQYMEVKYRDGRKENEPG